MVSRTLSGGAIAVLAGAAMLALSSGPSSAFTHASPSLERPVVAANIEPVYWHHWGWHHWHHWGGITGDGITGAGIAVGATGINLHR
jgi:hypothetical protein